MLKVWYLTSSIAISLEWKLADLWIGAYVYTAETEGVWTETNLYLVLIPTIVLHIVWLTQE